MQLRRHRRRSCLPDAGLWARIQWAPLWRAQRTDASSVVLTMCCRFSKRRKKKEKLAGPHFFVARSPPARTTTGARQSAQHGYTRVVSRMSPGAQADKRHHSRPFQTFFQRSNKDGFGWLNIRIICIRIRLKYKYRYPYSYSILIWMSYGCIRIRI